MADDTDKLPLLVLRRCVREWRARTGSWWSADREQIALLFADDHADERRREAEERVSSLRRRARIARLSETGADRAELRGYPAEPGPESSPQRRAAHEVLLQTPGMREALLRTDLAQPGDRRAARAVLKYDLAIARGMLKQARRRVSRRSRIAIAFDLGMLTCVGSDRHDDHDSTIRQLAILSLLALPAEEWARPTNAERDRYIDPVLAVIDAEQRAMRAALRRRGWGTDERGAWGARLERAKKRQYSET